MIIKRLLKKGLAVSLLSVMALSMVACGSKEDDKKATSAMDKDEIILGFDDTFVPMGYKNDAGEYEGFDVDLAKEVGKKIGKTIKFQPIDWSMKETELNNKNVDLLWNGYTITEERKEKVAFSKPYMKNRQAIITLVGSDIKTKSDLSEKKVAAQNQSSAVDAIGDYEKNFKELVTFKTNDEALRDLESGRVDAVVADEILARHYIKLKGEDKYAVLEEDFGDEEYGIGMRKDDTKLQEAVNNAIKELIEEGVTKTISEKYFGEDIVLK